jgi:hypothetical protein
MIDVITLCNYCILANVLDFRTYGFPGVGEGDSPTPRDRDQRQRWDRNALTMLDRHYITHIRGLSINLIRWLSQNFEVTPAEATSPFDFKQEFCGNYIMRQACAILNYKKMAETQQLATIPWCKFKDVEQQLNYVFDANTDEEEEPWFGDWYTKKLSFAKYNSLSFGNTKFTITRKESPGTFTGRLLRLVCHVF